MHVCKSAQDVSCDLEHNLLRRGGGGTHRSVATGIDHACRRNLHSFPVNI